MSTEDAVKETPRIGGQRKREDLLSMPFFDHLDELRKRIVYALVAFFGAFLLCWAFAARIYDFLAQPIYRYLPEGKKLVFLGVTDPFLLYVKVAALAGIFLASPVVLYQVWAFVAPGLYKRERYMAGPFIFSGSLLFLSGGAFAYYVAFPFAVEFLLSMGEQFEPNITVTHYLSFLMTVVLGLGLMFELPTIIFLLARLGLVTPGFLLRHFRWAVLIIFTVAAIITPTPDVVNLCIFAVPTIFLYLVGVGVAAVFGKRGESWDAEKPPPPLGLGLSTAIYAGTALVFYLETAYLLPYLENRYPETEPILWWFLVAGAGLFLPLLGLAVALLSATEELPLAVGDVWIHRLRFRRMSAADWGWTVAALVTIGALSGLLLEGVGRLLGSVDPNPPFLKLEALTPERYWILAVWLPVFAVGILSEEILWRGVILPRQEAAFGKWAWVVHALGWGLFHAAMGWQALLALVPILFVLSYVVQRRRNSWIGVVVHAAFNGAGFLAVAFGLLGA